MPRNPKSILKKKLTEKKSHISISNLKGLRTEDLAAGCIYFIHVKHKPSNFDVNNR
jgi:hypothetical protein|tara:strand:+ start:193 stop:360 length:168 start_codon:yes stop_codon:yes gene_type:complete